jgi:hypothetical protein
VTGRARIALTAALLMTAPAMLDAQDPSPVPTQMPPEVQALMMEAQQIQARLAPLEQRVMQDPELQTEQQEVMLRVTTAMLEADPTLEAHVQRMQTLQEEAQAAQAAGDQERLGRSSERRTRSSPASPRRRRRCCSSRRWPRWCGPSRSGYRTA